MGQRAGRTETSETGQRAETEDREQRDRTESRETGQRAERQDREQEGQKPVRQDILGSESCETGHHRV